MERQMLSDEKILINFAKRLGQESYQEYHSCFTKVMKILQSELKIAEGTKAGSLAMGFKIKNTGDIDIIFTYKKPFKTAPTLREELRTILADQLGDQARVTLNDPKTSRAIHVYFYKEEVKMDIVYKDFDSYKHEKKMIDHFNQLPDEITYIIRLVKFVERNFPNSNIKKRKIHNLASTASGNDFCAKLKYTINACGGGGKVQCIYDFLIEEATKIIKNSTGKS